MKVRHLRRRVYRKERPLHLRGGVFRMATLREAVALLRQNHIEPDATGNYHFTRGTA